VEIPSGHRHGPATPPGEPRPSIPVLPEIRRHDVTNPVKGADPWNGVPRRVLSAVTPSSAIPAVILIVEDEALVRLSGVDTFADAGFQTIEAVNSDDALESLVANPDVQLLFTDVNMPGATDGLALSRQVHDRWPHIDIIVVSGLSVPKAHELPVGARFLRKPYDADTAVRHARELMAAHRSGLEAA
jgi:CheY-like chemotaxis protein